MKKRTFKSFIIFAAACVLLTSCGIKQSKTTDSSNVALTYWGTLGSSAASIISSFNDIPMYQKAQELVGVEIAFKHPPVGQEGEQFNLMIASRDLSDIMEAGWQTYPGGPQKAISDQVIVKLDDYVDAYAPNFKSILNENPNIEKQARTDDEALYSFPAIALNAINISTGPIVRYDWLAELGMEMPQTIADWEKMLYAFKEQKGASAPLTGVKGDLLSFNNHVGAFGIGISYYIDNGKVKYGPLERNFKDYILKLRKWYAQGLIDPDIFATNSKNVETNMVTGKSGATYGGIGGSLGNFTNAARNVNPDYTLKGSQYPVMNPGDIPRIANQSWEVRTSGMAAITTKNKNPELSVKFLDLFYGAEGNLLKNFGVEGESYSLVDGEPQYTDLVLKNPDGLSIAQVLAKYTRAASPSPGLIDPRYHQQYYQLPEQQETMQLWGLISENVKETALPPLTPTQEEAEILASIKSNTETYFEEQMTKIIMGLADESAYDETIAQLKSMGIEQSIAIYQQAYERYQKR